MEFIIAGISGRKKRRGRRVNMQEGKKRM